MHWIAPQTNGGAKSLHKCTPCTNVRRMSTVLAQDHFYSDFLSLSLTTLTHKGSARMTRICSGLKHALAYVTGGMSSNNHSRSAERINQTNAPYSTPRCPFVSLFLALAFPSLSCSTTLLGRRRCKAIVPRCPAHTVSALQVADSVCHLAHTYSCWVVL